jgi:pimeloyl-ACP methyl ester carboxylesterase
MQARILRSLVRSAVVAASAVVGVSAVHAHADWHPRPHKPIVLKAQGNFYVGGEKVFTEYNDPLLQEVPGQVAPFPPGTITVNEIYVDYQFPLRKKFKWPVAMFHGGGHHGGFYQSTPDGRESWQTRFLRRGFNTFVVDSVNRGRSGYDIREIVAVKRGEADPATIPRINNYSWERAWEGFRIGPTFGTPYPNTQFPVPFFSKYVGNLVPAFRDPIETERNVAAYVALLDKIGPAILMPWSQSGPFVWQTVLRRSDKVKAVVTLEAATPTDLEANLATYCKVPILMVVGDFDPERAAAAHAAEATLRAAGCTAKALVLPEVGIFGNSHVFVVERNNAQIADLIIKWLKRNVRHHRPHHHGDK